MIKKNSNFVFSQVPSVVRPRSVFDRSRNYKTTFNAGKLIPFYWDEILPGDTIAKLDVTAFARLATPVVPFMDNLYMDFFFFFVPYRLVWDNWQRFCGEQDNPEDSTDYLLPVRNLLNRTGETVVGSLPDYFGLPVNDTYTVSALPFRCYNLIYNEFFRDENLCASLIVRKDDGPDNDTNSPLALADRGKRKSDPFTSALPWPQKGPGVELPIGGSAPVGAFYSGDFFPVGAGYASAPGTHITVRGTEQSQVPSAQINTGLTIQNLQPDTISITYPSMGGSGSLPLAADLTQATSVTINALREAFQIQKWYEQLARGGSRYLELVLSMFGCHTGDARLQRPEYLGGGSTPIQIHSIAQTSSTDATSPQGNLAAYGVAGTSGVGFSKSFVEHGLVIGLVSVRGDYTYQNNIDRFWSRRTKFDFYWPAFAHLGEVGIKNKEIWYSGADDPDYDPEGIFGYQEIWYEYRYGISKITGKLRSGVDGSLDVWHLAQNFANCPKLNSEFIKEDPPVSRVLAVQDEPQFIFDAHIDCRMARVMPVYSTPGLIDHF